MSAKAKGWHVLVVDEELRDQQLLLRAFRRHGAEVIFAGGIQPAHSTLPLYSWAAVLLELRDCGDEGFALVSEVLRREPSPVVIASFTKLDAEDAIRLQEVGVKLLPSRCPLDQLVRLTLRLRAQANTDAGAVLLAPATSVAPDSGSHGPPYWAQRVQDLLNCAEMATEEKAPLRDMLHLVMTRTLRGRGASWRELAQALGRTSGHQASDGYVRQQVFRMRRRYLPSVGVALSYSRSRGYFFSEGNS